ncbi:MAG: prephenate dehydrogenase/arogenate dehydrogenase family protein, partial [Desulfomonilaceae bacterium]
MDFRKSRICIIGGKGRMGSWFASLFQQAGIDAVVSDRKDSPISDTIVTSSDVIMLATPLTAIEEIMKSVGKFIRSDALLLDISSVKRDPVDLMLKYSQCEVIGMHPLFGPSTASLDGQVFFLCPSRVSRWMNPLRSFLEDAGAKITLIDPDEHDKLMACFQTLRHVLLTCLGSTLIEMGFASCQEIDSAGMWFDKLLEMMRHQFKQPSGLYADLALGNPYSVGMLKMFLKNFNDLAHHISTGDRDRLVSDMDEVAQFCAVEAKSDNSAWGW